MGELEKMQAHFGELVNACSDFVNAYVNLACNARKAFMETLDVESIVEAAAYTKAAEAHPEWVHRAMYSKKKRIRKKYNDKIMRYWRGEQ